MHCLLETVGTKSKSGQKWDLETAEMNISTSLLPSYMIMEQWPILVIFSFLITKIEKIKAYAISNWVSCKQANAGSVQQSYAQSLLAIISFRWLRSIHYFFPRTQKICEIFIWKPWIMLDKNKQMLIVSANTNTLYVKPTYS